ncbi:amidohydrolase [Microbacterium sp.]|uniref:amidohydrolase n=1 Tax=Microbacterium sp. TaxID=51671 RepID=UPI0039E38F92
MSESQLFLFERVDGHPDATAILTSGGRITAMLTTAEAAQVDRRTASVHDIGGWAYPGFVDSHSHPVLASGLLRGVDLSAVASIAELRDTLAGAARDLPPRAWVLGWGLAYSLWGDASPDAASIDGVTGGRPVSLQFFDCHALLLDRVALGLADAERMPVFDSGSRAVTDDDGRATGLVLEEEAMDYVRRAIPTEPEGTRRARLSAILRDMAASGLTGLHVMDALGDGVVSYADLEARSELPLRVKLHRWFTPAMAEAGIDPSVAPAGRGRRWHHHGVKLFLDGTVDNGTAWLSDPDVHGGSRASIWTDPEEYRRVVLALASAGIPTATHAIGDAAIRWAARTAGDAHERFAGIRHRIEHLEVSDAEVIAEVRRSGAVASMQPTHCTHFVRADGTDTWSRRLGDRRRHGWPLRSFRDAGVPLAFGSDFPIAPFEPLPILADAVLRRRSGTGAEPIRPEEGVGIADGIAGYTRGAAYAAGVEAEEGALAPGFLADISVFDADLSKADPETLAAVHVRATVVDGVVSRYAR